MEAVAEIDAGPSLYLMDTAQVALAPDIVSTTDGLKDEVTDLVYRLNSVGEGLGKRIAAGTTFGRLVSAMSREYALDERDARSDLTAFIGELHAHRLLSIRQGYFGELWHRLVQLLITLLLFTRLRVWPSQPPSPTRRYPATPGWLARAWLEAHAPTMVGGVALAVLAASVYGWRNVRLGLPAISSATLYTVAVVLGYAAGLSGSALLHELAHYAVARRYGVRVRSIYGRITAVGISHEAADPWDTILVSAAGPLAAITLMGGLCLLILNLPIGSMSARLPAAFACLLIAAQHAPGLIPVTRDGKAIAQGLGKLLFTASSKR